MLNFSIVIPCYNEEEYIGNLLSDFCSQTYNNHKFEVVVVDNSSCDSTCDVLWQFAQENPKLNLRIMHEYKKGVSNARNSGGLSASGMYVVFLDADNRVPSDFLTFIEHNIEYYNMAALTIRTVPDRITLKGWLVFSILELIKIIVPRPFGKSVVRKDFFTASGGFDSKIALGENMEFLIRIKHLVKESGMAFGHCNKSIKCSLRRFDKIGYLRTLGPWLVSYLGFFGLKYKTMSEF